MHRKNRGTKGRWLAAALAGLMVSLGLSGVLMTPARAAGASGVSTTTNVDWGSAGDGACLNGSGSGDVVNCNHYSAKPDVWLSGLPGPSGLPDGDYYFAVLAPGGQADPVDGAADNLSDDANGSVGDRTFHLTGGAITAYDGGHHYDAARSKIEIAPFDDTTNDGGVYVLAVCSLATGTCKFDAFKVDPGTIVVPSGTISAAKTANPSHTRTVSWKIEKVVDGGASPTFHQAGPQTVTYGVAVTKTAVEAYGVTGTITVTNSTANPVEVTVTDDGLVPDVGATCALTGAATFPVAGKDPVTLDEGHQSVGYACTLAGDAPDPSTNYTNTATVTYDLDGTQSLPVASSPFAFPDATPTDGSAPESITVTDTNAPAGAGFPKSAGDSTSWTYQQTLFNRDCVTYPNTAAISETSQSASTSVLFCGPNSGGLTMGWWQNKNGQALLGNNLAAACKAVNGYLPGAFAHGGTSYLPDAYQQNKTYGGSAYSYVADQCSTTGTKSYLPAFDLNVFSAANASGSGAMMVEGQWLTTALDTATYAVSTSAGKPTLSSAQKVLVPAALQTGLGLAACDSVANLLKNSATQYPTYAASKASGVTPALITLLNAINNNQAITCQ